MSRLACLAVPLFPLAARLRSEPELRHEAAAVFAGNGHAARILAATRRARKGGIRRGMTLPQARALMPKLCARGRDAECERAAQESLLEAAESFSPRVEDAGEGVAFLDLAGLERHFPGDDPEAALGRALAAAVERTGLAARVGIASSKLAARVAAESPATPAIVPPGEEAAFLAPLPLARLAPAAEVVETLGRWGIRSIGELARLPRNEVASRLGPAGQRLHERARGLDSRPLVPRLPPPGFDEGMDLDWALTTLEPFLFVARAALERLCRRLETRGLGCARLELALRLEPDGHHQGSIRLPAPSRDVKTLLTLVRLELERRPPGAPVVGFRFTAQPDRPRDAQLSLFGATTLSPDRLATTLARLFALLGPERAGAPCAVDGHRPEAAALADYSPPPQADVKPAPRAGRGLLAVRVLRPALPLEVIVAERGRAAGRPLEVRPAVEGGGGGRPRIAGRVRVAAGPWALEDGWWTDNRAEREYWDLELADGGVYRVFRDRRAGDWFADGIYD